MLPIESGPQARSVVTAINTLAALKAPISRAHVQLMCPNIVQGSISRVFVGLKKVAALIETGQESVVDLSRFRKTPGVPKDFSADAASERAVRDEKESKTYDLGPSFDLVLAYFEETEE